MNITMALISKSSGTWRCTRMEIPYNGMYREKVPIRVVQLE